ncbi:MAG: DNA repair protein RecO [Planctomycetes bacterium]|nr:DNA repair protein RecO [Planctomycetota bacterium]
MRYQADAIVLRRIPFSESSQIVHLLTAREGRVACLARGIYRDKTAFGGAFDLATRGRVDASRRRSTDLDLVHSFTVTRAYRGLRRSLDRWLAAAYVLELAASFSWPRDRQTELFLLLAATLDGLEGAPERAVARLWATSFVARLIECAGFRPALDACVACGSAAAASPRAALSLARGGLLCRRCAPGDRSVRSCSAPVLDLLVRLLAGRAPPAAPAAQSVDEARRLLDAYLEYRLESRLCSGRLLDLAR